MGRPARAILIAGCILGLCVAALRLADAPAKSAAPQVLSLPLNPAVRRATIGETICAHGWARRVRPPYVVTHRIKLAKLREAGLAPSDISRFELDHRIPIDLGGALADPANLALEPWREARQKDDVELCLAIAVCAGAVDLRAAQKAIWTDWRKAARFCAS